MEKIRVGVFGAGRGMTLAENFMLLNCEIVALCDNHQGLRSWRRRLSDRENLHRLCKGKQAAASSF